MNNSLNSGNFPTAMFADCLANSKEIFQLIDQVFPLDSCRHYEVLPLKLDGIHLVLGMLDPNNEESIKFANSIAKVFKYDLEIKLIDLQTHQIILANYPQNQSQSYRKQQDQNKTVIDTNFNPNTPLKNITNTRTVDSAPTIISSDVADPIREIDSKPELSDLPPDLDFLKDLDFTPQPEVKPPLHQPDSAATVFENPDQVISHKPGNHLDNKATIIAENPDELLTPKTLQDDLQIVLGEAQISQLIAETLGKTTPEVVEPETPDFLPPLLSQISWQKLLEKAFQHQSDTLKLTRYSDRGSIIAEQNSIIQSSLEEVALPIFCSLIDEIKRMARLPQNTASNSKKVVLERFHAEERILLRLEFNTQKQSEEVAIQILRGQALRMYEQQQMDRIGDQALQLAKQLEKTLRKIQACFDSAELNNLTELQTIHSRINHQLRLLDKQA